MKNIYFTFLVLFSFVTSVFSQQETVINYDLIRKKTDKPIPFAKPITLVVDKINPADVKRIDAYQVELKNTQRVPVSNSMGIPVRDIELSKISGTSSLEIKIPPLAPNEEFDLFVLLKISEKAKKKLLQINSKLMYVDKPVFESFRGRALPPFQYLEVEKYFNSVGQREYLEFQDITADKDGHSQGVGLDFLDYQHFFNQKLDTAYYSASFIGNYKFGAGLTNDDVKAIAKVNRRGIDDLKNPQYMLRVTENGIWNSIQLGLSNIENVSDNDFKQCSMYDLITRQENIIANLRYFSAVQQKVEKLLSVDLLSVTIGTTRVNLQTVRDKVSELNKNLYINQEFLSKRLKLIDQEIDKNASISQSVRIVGSSAVSSDLKTQGASLLFLDTGIAGVAIAGIDDKVNYIPKIYLGLTIYFKPYDKNTRDKDFVKIRNLDPPRRRTSTINSNGDTQYGPDYDIVQKWSLWQHLALNIGATLGSYKNYKDFDNSVSGTSLLVGPAYRIYKGFKLSAGASFVNRTSRNPLISDKRLSVGGYFSASVDVDFVSHVQKFLDKL